MGENYLFTFGAASSCSFGDNRLSLSLPLCAVADAESDLA